MTAEWKLPWAAHCRCGAVAIQITAPPLVTMACHCTGCQRMSASAYSLSLAIPTPGFAVTAGKPVRGGTQLPGAPEHYHCPHCKSWLFTKLPGMADFVNVRATMLDDHAWFRPWIETATAEALPFAGNLGAPHRFADIPSDLAAWAPVIADFAQRGPRP